MHPTLSGGMKDFTYMSHRAAGRVSGAGFYPRHWGLLWSYMNIPQGRLWGQQRHKHYKKWCGIAHTLALRRVVPILGSTFIQCASQIFFLCLAPTLLVAPARNSFITGKFWKRWEYQTTWPAFWDICMHVKKQQLELDTEQQTGSKSGKEYVKGVYCHRVI